MNKPVFWMIPAIMLACACAHAPAPGAFRASPEPLTAEGSAPMDERNPGASREKAVLDAQRAAVLRAANLFMDETARAEGQALLEIGLLKTPQLYASKSKIVSEWRDGNQLRVSARVWVHHDKIVSALRGLKLSGPGVSGPAALFAQRNGADKAFAAAFREAFSRRSKLQLKDLPPGTPVDASAGPGQAVLEAAVAAGADLVFLADASASPSGGGISTGFIPSRAEASLKVFDVKDGSELLSFSSQANAVDASEKASLSKALASAAELLAQEAASRSARLVEKPAPVRIKVAGLAGLEALERLRDQLLGVGLSSLRAETYSDGVAVLSAVPGRSDLHELASAVLRTDSMGLELDGVGPQEMAFSIGR